MKSFRNIFGSNLTASQEIAVELLEDFLVSESQIFILKGYAGTGKTFLMAGLTEYLSELEVKYHIMAPTGRAARVISKWSGNPAFTLHKGIYALDKKLPIEKKNTKIDLYYGLKENTNNGCIYIIDESSMISNEYTEADYFRFGSGCLLDDLISYANLEFNKIIFIGDPAQLPPVKSELSPALSAEYITEKYALHTDEFEMSDVVRQSEESAILYNATKLRNAIADGVYDKFSISFIADDIQKVSKAAFLNVYLSACGNEINPDTIVIANTNRTVQYYNETVREYFFPEKKQIQAGDRVLLVHNSYSYDFDFMNGEIAEVLWADSDVEKRMVMMRASGNVYPIELAFRDVVLRFNAESEDSHEIECKIFDNLLYSPERDISVLEMRALYLDFLKRTRSQEIELEGDQAFKDPYLNCLRVKFGYAVTCHKSQGGEWRNVFVDFNTAIPKNSQNFFRWAYTAVTRASKLLFVMNPPRFNIRTNNEESVRSFDASFEPKEYPQDLDINQRKIYRAVLQRTHNTEIAVENIHHLPGCERYGFRTENGLLTFNIWYTVHGKITLIDSQAHDSRAKEYIYDLLTDLNLRNLL